MLLGFLCFSETRTFSIYSKHGRVSARRHITKGNLGSQPLVQAWMVQKIAGKSRNHSTSGPHDPVLSVNWNSWVLFLCPQQKKPVQPYSNGTYQLPFYKYFLPQWPLPQYRSFQSKRQKMWWVHTSSGTKLSVHQPPCELAVRSHCSFFSPVIFDQSSRVTLHRTELSICIQTTVTYQIVR